ncbi:MAG: hypothetical protein AB7E60_02790 [Sphingobium sp.]
MAKTLSDETIRRRDVRVKLEWRDIEAVLARMAMAEAGIEGAPGAKGVVAEVELKQETEGSPSYGVRRWSGIVSVTVPIA